MTGTRSPYITAKMIEGAKSEDNGTPPTGEGILKVEFKDMTISIQLLSGHRILIQF